MLFYHALTGCDYTASFSRKGKVNPFKLLKKDSVAIEAFATILKSKQSARHAVRSTVKKFICNLYSKKKLFDLDDVRLHIFLQKYQSSGRDDAPISAFKRFDGSMIPPCNSVLEKKIYRAIYVGVLWKSATSALMPDIDPTDYAWIVKDGGYQINWYNGDALPAQLDVAYEREG